MDLRLFFRVISRFRYLVIAGLLLGFVLAFISVFRISFSGGSPKISYRQSETYSSGATLWITQGGSCTYWCAWIPSYTVNKATGQKNFQLTGGVTQFTQLAQLYVQLANSSLVYDQAVKKGPLPGSFQASTVVDKSTSFVQPLPFIDLYGYASTAKGAVETAERGAEAFRSYVAENQQASNVDPNRRVVIELATPATSAHLVSGRKLTTPIVIFLVTLIATLVLAFMLENLRPRARVAPVRVDSRSAGVPADVEPAPAPTLSTAQLESLATAHESRSAVPIESSRH